MNRLRYNESSLLCMLRGNTVNHVRAWGNYCGLDWLFESRVERIPRCAKQTLSLYCKAFLIEKTVVLQYTL